MSGELRLQELWVGGTEGYHTFRIPSLVVTPRGTLVAICEGRKLSHHDVGLIDLQVRRSTDGGKTWSKSQTIYGEPDMTCGNPAPIVDRSTGFIWLPFCKNPAYDAAERAEKWRQDRPVWVTHSEDDGVTWSEPREITSTAKKPDWTWYSTGPVHGIQLSSGRMIASCTHRVRNGSGKDDARYGHVLYSDDHGASWHAGDAVPEEGVNECVAAELVDGRVYLNLRDQAGRGRRHVAFSRDSGKTFPEHRWDEALADPKCQGSVVRLTDERRHDRNRLLFCNPAGTGRDHLTVRLSYDEGETWAVSKLLEPGKAAYSDLAVTEDLSIFGLFERGVDFVYEKLTLARFDLEWLTDGKDRVR